MFEGFCIFGFQEFFKNFFCMFIEVNKTMYGNNEDVPKKLFDNLYPESLLDFSCTYIRMEATYTS